MTADEFLHFDDNTPTTKELSENWEDELVQRHKNKAATEEDNEDSDQEPQEQEPVLRLKAHSATLIQSEMFGLERGLPADYLEHLRKAQEILQQHVINVKCQAKQVSLDDFMK